MSIVKPRLNLLLLVLALILGRASTNLLSGTNEKLIADVKKEVEEAPSKKPDFSNQGFVKGLEKNNLKIKFPACDEFLNVKWINKNQGIGYVKHDLYKNGAPSGEMESLIFIRPQEDRKLLPYDRLELYTFRKTGKIDALFDGIKNGEVTRNLNVLYKGKATALLRHNYEMTYAENSRSVCVVYPDMKLAWIVEAKKAKFSNEFDNLFRIKIQNSWINSSEDRAGNLYIADLNGDGIEDLYNDHGYMILSSGEKFKVAGMKYKNHANGFQYWSIEYQDGQLICDILFLRNEVFITTDGNFFYINNQCKIV